ncbi:MAG: hypothetical protein L0H93_20110 [Nocardioides sp.]|nr:hypothetical protein [Nocardioides sp.]
MLGSSTYDPDLRRRRLIVAAVTGALLLTAAVTYVLLTHNQTAAPPPADPTTSAGTELPADPSAARDDGTLPGLPPIPAPAEFAEVVAHAIFDWDTTALAPRTAYLERIATIADPTGEESPGLISDVRRVPPPATVAAQRAPGVGESIDVEGHHRRAGHAVPRPGRRPPVADGDPESRRRSVLSAGNVGELHVLLRR